MELVVSKDVGIKNVNEFYSKMKSLLEDEDEIIVDLHEIENIHLSVATVIMAAYREAKTIGKKIKLKNVSSGLREQLFLAGFHV